MRKKNTGVTMSKLEDPILQANGLNLLHRLEAKRGEIDGMYMTLLHHPVLTEHVSNLGTYLRFGSTLPGAVREFTILYCARTINAPYEWVKHVPPALEAGLSQDMIQNILIQKNDFITPYHLIPSVVDCVLALQSIPTLLQDQLIRAFTIKGLLELVILIGFYRMIAGVIAAFDVPLPPHTQLPW
jgi:4-carboxymuconolactone decarboxylase